MTITKILKANERKIDQWLKILRSRIDLFGFLKAVMAVSNPFMGDVEIIIQMKLAYGPLDAGYTKSHI